MRILFFISFVFLIFFLVQSCQQEKARGRLANFNYGAFKDSMHIENYDAREDTSNIFDNGIFIPDVDSFDLLISRIDSLWRHEEKLMEEQRLNRNASKEKLNYAPPDQQAIDENIALLTAFLLNKNKTITPDCREKECIVYAEIVKSKQKLYLYIQGDLKDSFKVSTGIRSRETPNFNLSPSGPVFTKYTSRKFPGGNFQGLGNMPYAVFLKGGYAIHGTTAGNFALLGKRASHGCIRLHPGNAKTFNELIKMVGLENTWVKITD